MRCLVVGAGFSGAVIARELAEANVHVTLIEKRDHIAGNAYDEVNQETGIRYHKYGPHIFHTNNEKVFVWLSKFTDWINYEHKVKAILDSGETVVIPPNLETIERLGKENVLDILYRPYTKKMWDKSIEELDPSILNRVPFRDDYNELYFPKDKYQMMPKEGYTAIIANILSHPNISVELNTKFEKTMEDKFDHVFNSMPIDEYYNYKFGKLPYRSIKFHHSVVPVPKFQELPTMNFTHDGVYTRVTEWKNYPNHGANRYKTLVTFEEPCDYSENNFERYYPVKDVSGENRKRYEIYKNLENDKVTFIGRCGQYVYIDMHQAISSALKVASDFRRRFGA
ncbi:UDP-galactopyranose mutase [Thalassocella blandensis]|nr:UDP-galactopyranose mutase [Thalassocella blandensis]